MKPHDGNGGSSGEYDTFGQLLRRSRESYPDRFRRKYPGAPRVKLTALALIECLREKGYPLTSGAYSEIENGSNLPRDPQRFVDAIAECLLLDEQKDYEELARRLAYDIVRARASKRMADIAFGRESADDDSEDVDDEDLGDEDL